MTVGEKIKKARLLKGITQAELGEKVELTGDRRGQYECDVRKPKPDKLALIATALDVDMLALSEPDITNDYGIMHLLFELEESRGLNLLEIEGKHYLSFSDSDDPMKNKELKSYIEAWYKKKSETIIQANDSPDTIKQKKDNYDSWKMRFPINMAEETANELSLRARKKKLEEELAQVTKELNKK